ncbi:HeH/LEM domain-containing protein [Clostridium culturomicium]|uniref:HeH/LEM domain-containing protein n=1 Tax=Clostridium culturomicium TaxID=1499683 RepID=UPI003857B430
MGKLVGLVFKKGPKELNSLKMDELKAIADEKGIEYDSKIKKEGLIQLLEGTE